MRPADPAKAAPAAGHGGHGGHGKPEGEAKMPGLPEIDLREWGGKKDGERQWLDRRMFFQVQVFDVDRGVRFDEVRTQLIDGLGQSGVPHVVYEDANKARGLGLVAWSENPDDFVHKIHPAVRELPMQQRDDFTMIGRTYSLGHEPELEHALLHRSAEYVMDPQFPWHVWYPLRRHGTFEKLEKHEQSIILREHAAIGMAYGRTGMAHDVRLACHGMDAGDNEFVIGLIGTALYPLSHLVQTMRHTKQTSEFIQKMGPFFVGRVVARGPVAAR
jgi:chlorite dismutase